MRYRLGDAPVQQADAHTGGEHHGEPRQRAEFGFGITTTETHLTQRRQRQAGAEQHRQIAHDDDEPVEVLQDPALDAFQRLTEDHGIAQCQENQQQDDGEGNGEYDAMEVQAEHSNIEVSTDYVFRNHRLHARTSILFL